MQVKRMYVSPELIQTMLTTGYELKGKLRVTEGLPEGAVLVGVGYDIQRRAWAMDFQHGTFDYTPDGMIPPELVVTVEKTSAVLVDALSE